jgi:hypothetical protein
MKKDKGKNLASPVQSKEHDKYRAEDDLRTLTRAEEIRGDKGRMQGATRAHGEQMDALSRVGRSMAGRDPKSGRGRRGRARRRGGKRR